MSKFLMSVAVCLLAGCATQGKGPVASAQLTPTKGNTTSGTVLFTQTHSTVLVSADIQGLKPNSAHGFHVHDKGDCSSGDGMSTGGHFNPNGQVHGAHGGGAHHAGDFPSLMADANGNAKLTFESSTITLDAGITNIIGRGLIVHRDPDDFKTQPTGNSGPRLACAVIANQ
ncbi:MAG: superoxide dismutase family protein [Burkholderiales bacterium]|jgi:Cu-Zn family superoxide dismutase|nr:superoxide dismutase family protein [Burkholderiales bacterium]